MARSNLRFAAPFFAAVLFAGVLAFGSHGALGSVLTASPGLPPNTGAYQSSTASDFNFGSGLDIVAQIVMITPNAGSDVQSFSGGNEFDSYQATVTGQASTSGPSGSFSPFSFTANVTTETLGRTSNSQLGTFTTSTTGFAFSVPLGGGNTLSGMLSQPSPGQTTISDAGGGQFMISSFFDIFTELSIDGGPFVPNTGPSGNPGQPSGTVDGSQRFTLAPTPEPQTLTLLASAAVCGLFFVRVRRSPAR